MTSRERVLAAFEHREPDRVPVWCGASAEFMAKVQHELGLDEEAWLLRVGDDFRRVRARYAGPEFALSAGAESRTVFGIERRGMGYGQPISHPLAGATQADVEAYPWPDPAWTDASSVRAEALRWNREYAVLGGDWSPYFHDAIDLMGMDGLYYAMYDAPHVVEAVMERLTGFYLESSRRIFDAAADAIDIFFLGNDFGSQTGPLLSEGLFRRFVLPSLKRFIDLGHSYGLKVMLHCCGGIRPLLPAMIEAGLDGVHAVQPSCAGMDLSELKSEFGSRILFNGAIDSHHVLINGTPRSVRDAVRDVLAVMMPGGGYVAGASHDSILEETPVENVLTMFDAVHEFGAYA
jgi:uroporphyrinogen decarboxylase